MDDWPAIVQRYGNVVWATAWRLLGDTEQARDCYQDTFLAAVELSRRQPVHNWPAALKCIASAKAIDRLRRDKMRAASPLTDNVTDDHPGPDQALSNAELLTRLRKHLSALPPQQAQVFWLRTFDDLTYEQIGRELGLSPQNVGVLLHRARTTLAHAMADLKPDTDRNNTLRCGGNP